MKKSELRRLVSEYKAIRIKLVKVHNNKLKEKLKEIEHKYFHETGRILRSEIKEIT
jgi:hypothetical protein